jgi:hypothetical protein
MRNDAIDKDPAASRFDKQRKAQKSLKPQF